MCIALSIALHYTIHRSRDQNKHSHFFTQVLKLALSTLFAEFFLVSCYDYIYGIQADVSSLCYIAAFVVSYMFTCTCQIESQDSNLSKNLLPRVGLESTTFSVLG